MKEKDVDHLRVWAHQLEDNLKLSEQHLNDLLNPIVEAVKEIKVAENSIKRILTLLGEKEIPNGEDHE